MQEMGDANENANPSAPWDAIGGGVGMEHIHRGGLVQLHHAIDSNNNMQNIAMAALILFVYK